MPDLKLVAFSSNLPSVEGLHSKQVLGARLDALSATTQIAAAYVWCPTFVRVAAATGAQTQGLVRVKRRSQKQPVPQSLMHWLRMSSVQGWLCTRHWIAGTRQA